MDNLLPWFRARLSNRRDSEHGQALVRIILILLILAYVLLPSSRAGLDPDKYHGVLTIVLVVFAVRAWRQGRRRWAMATVAAAVAAAVVTWANLTTTLDPARGLLDFLGGS